MSADVPFGRLPVPRAHRMSVVAARPETPSILTFLFRPEGGGFAYEAGQSVILRLPGVNDPRGPVRRFTLSSSPTETLLAITTRMTGSPFKEALRALRPGDPVQLVGPLGGFPLEPPRPAVMIAGGIGISPFRAMVRYAADVGLSIPMVLLYANRTPEEIAFREELDALASPRGPLRVVYTITRPGEAQGPWSGRVGRIDARLVAGATRGLDHPVYYLCGRPAMVDAIAALLHGDLGVPASDIRLERFVGY